MPSLTYMDHVPLDSVFNLGVVQMCSKKWWENMMRPALAVALNIMLLPEPCLSLPS